MCRVGIKESVNKLINAILILVLLFVGSVTLSKAILLLALKNRWLDIPNTRSSHSTPVPKSGGIAFALMFLSAVIYCFMQGILLLNELLALLVGAVIAVLGIMDDYYDLKILIRLSVHLICVMIALFLLGGPPDIPVYIVQLNLNWIVFIVATLAFTWFINLYNFMDGIDGLAATEAVFVGLAAGFFCWQQGDSDVAFIMLCLSSCVAGFLILNYPPAKIFMGDVGSNFLGLIIGALALISMHHGVMTVWSWSVLLGVFVVDSTSTLLERYHANEIWYHGHRSHFYQQAASKYCSHVKVDALVALINVLWLFPMTWITLQFRNWGLLVTVVAYAPLLYFSLWFKSQWSEE